MPLSWSEIRQRAIHFSHEWAAVSRERAEAQSFWNDFFHVFGKIRRHVASFEEAVKSLKGTYAYIYLFWKGTLIAESKSLGKPLDTAHSQASCHPIWKAVGKKLVQVLSWHLSRLPSGGLLKHTSLAGAHP